MATYHCTVKKAKCGQALRHADYILREGVYEKSDKKEELVYKSFGNLPEWADTPQDFWRAADEHERANANVYYEFEIALPNELGIEEHKKLVDLMIENHIGNKPFTYAIHEKAAALSDGTVRQPHVHLMFSERMNDEFVRSEKEYFKRANSKNPERGGTRKDDRFTESLARGSAEVTKIRKACEEYINQAYKENGLSISVSSASLEKQREDAIAAGDMKKAAALNRVPENHLGPKLAQQSMRQAKEIGKSPTSEDCLAGFATERSRSAFIARALRETKIEMEKLEAEITALRKKEAMREASIQTLDKVTAQLVKPSEHVKEYQNTLYYQMKTLRDSLRENNAQIYNLKKGILSEDRLLLIAQSVYTKGQSKVLTGEYNTLLKERKALDSKMAAFREKPFPADEKARRAYYLESDQLSRLSGELAVREGKNARLIDEMRRKISLPVAKVRIEKIVAALGRKNEIRAAQVEKLAASNEKIKQQLAHLEELKTAFTESLEQETIGLKLEELQDEFDDFAAEYDDLRRQKTQHEFNLQAVEDVHHKVSVELYGHDLVKIIDYHIDLMEKDLHKNNKQSYILQKYLFDEAKLAQIAQSVYTRGKAKFLMKEYNALLKERKTYRERLDAFQNRPLPNVWSKAREKAAYYAEQDKLAAFDRALQSKEKRNLEQIVTLQAKLDLPEAKSKMAAIMEAMRGKMNVREQRIANFKQANDVILSQLSKLRSIKKEINGELRYHQFKLTHPITRASLPAQVISECNHLISQFRAAVTKAELARVKGSLKARLKGKDKEDEIQYERD